METTHASSCFKAIEKTVSNRKNKLVDAYTKKEKRVVSSVGALKTVASIAGYLAYAAMPATLREYKVSDGLDK